MKKSKQIMALLLTMCFCLGYLLTGGFVLRANAATSLSDWQGYWGEPVADGEGVRVSTNATYKNALSLEYIQFELVIGKLDDVNAGSPDWMKFGLGEALADMDSNSKISVKLENASGKLRVTLLEGATVKSSVDTDIDVTAPVSFAVKKQANAAVWDILVNGTNCFTTTATFANADGKTYLGFASWADSNNGDRATDLYYTINAVSNSKPALNTDGFVLQQGPVTSVSDWQGYWGDPVASAQGVQVSTNATYKNALSPEYIRLDVTIGKLDDVKAGSPDWMKFGLGEALADMDSNSKISVKLENASGKLRVTLFEGATAKRSVDTDIDVTAPVSFVIKKQADAEAWDISVNGATCFTTTTAFVNANGEAYIGLASWADGDNGNRITDLYYTINSVMNSELTDDQPSTTDPNPDDFVFEPGPITELRDWQGYWGDPVADENGVRVSTNATYKNALSPEYIRLDVTIGKLDDVNAGSADWMKLGLGEALADMDSNSKISVKLENASGKLRITLFEGATAQTSVNTNIDVTAPVSFVIKKQADAEAWDIIVNGVKCFTTTTAFVNADGKTYVGLASWADGDNGDRATDLYYVVNSVINSEEDSSPKTGDSGIAVLLSTCLVALASTVVVFKKMRYSA